MGKKKVVQAPRRVQDEAADALYRAKNVRLIVKKGPKTVRYTITFSVPQEPQK